MKETVKKVPVLRVLAKLIGHGLLERFSAFHGSENYWKERYRMGGTSGAGSTAALAEFKAGYLNELVSTRGIQSVIEWGCGDGRQLSLARYPRYFGLDVSPDAIRSCKRRFAGEGTKKFALVAEYSGEKAELALSLDVIYHLVEDDVFDQYMNGLFDSATKLVVAYSSNTNSQARIQPNHVRHREFTKWVEEHAPRWRLSSITANPHPYKSDWEDGSFANFYIFESLAPVSDS